MRLLHFGFKVHDIERTMRAYEELAGLKWDPVVEHVIPAGESEHRARVTHAITENSVEIELVQTVAGVSPDDAVLGEREGISHLAFIVDDLDAERIKAERRGSKVISEGSAPRASWIFLKDDRFGGALVQLVQLNGEAS